MPERQYGEDKEDRDVHFPPLSHRIKHHCVPEQGLFDFRPRQAEQLEMLALPLQVAAIPGLRRVDWYIDGRQVSSTAADRYSWPLARGAHEVYSRIWDAAPDPHVTEAIRFYVH